MSLEELEVPAIMRTAKSVGCRRLHLRAKQDRRMEMKLLSAKIRTLKNQCRTLREESQTDREMLTNLMTATNDLQDKTNQKLQECKIVSNELLSQSEILSTGMSETFEEFQRQYTKSLTEIFTGQNPESAQKEEKEGKEVLEFSLREFQYERKPSITCIDFKEVAETLSIKLSENNQESDQISIATPTRPRSDSLDSKLSSSSSLPQWKSSTRLHRKNSSLSDRPNPPINPKTQNIFKMYTYAVVITIVLTIVFFKVF